MITTQWQEMWRGHRGSPAILLVSFQEGPSWGTTGKDRATAHLLSASLLTKHFSRCPVESPRPTTSDGGHHYTPYAWEASQNQGIGAWAVTRDGEGGMQRGVHPKEEAHADLRPLPVSGSPASHRLPPTPRQQPLGLCLLSAGSPAALPYLSPCQCLPHPCPNLCTLLLNCFPLPAGRPGRESLRLTFTHPLSSKAPHHVHWEVCALRGPHPHPPVPALHPGQRPPAGAGRQDHLDRRPPQPASVAHGRLHRRGPDGERPARGPLCGARIVGAGGQLPGEGWPRRGGALEPPLCPLKRSPRESWRSPGVLS